MKVTFELTDMQVDGIKKYLFDTGTEKPTNKDVKEFVASLCYNTLMSPAEAVSDYIQSI